jgi:hypothetical protein
MIWIKAQDADLRRNSSVDNWQPINTAPFDRELELAVIDGGDAHVLVFPCRRIDGGWINAGTSRRIEVSPSHWREWRTDHSAEVAGITPMR